MLNKEYNLYGIPFDELLEQVKGTSLSYRYNFQKHTLELEQENELLAYVRLPLHFAINPSLELFDEEPVVLYLSMESGNAAICVMEGDVNTYHTTFSAYMSRKKQGFSQIKYLNKKGKSRAGSRVRLASTIAFFENINTGLEELFDEFDFDRIALGCSKTLLPYLFSSKVSCPFQKDDKRLYKIPVHLPQSNFTNLDKAIKKLKAPRLFYEDDEVLGQLGL